MDLGRPPRPAARVPFTAIVTASIAALAGCSFDDPGILVPSYTCSSTSDCKADRTTCVQNVCAVPEATGYSVVVRIEGSSSSSLVANTGGFSFSPTSSIVTGDQDLAYPTSRAVEGRIRLGSDYVVETQVEFRRTTPVAGFFDEIRTSSPIPAGVGQDGAPIDFRAAVVPSSIPYEAHFLPTTSPTPGVPGIPGEFVGKPLSDVFPPMLAALPTDSSTTALRLDLSYGTGLFTTCTAASETPCTVEGRILSSTAAGNTRAEESVTVVIEDERGVAVSTSTTTAADGSFRVRLGSPSRAHALRVSSSIERPAYPTLVLGPDALDPRLGGDVAVPRFEVIRFEGRVQRLTTLVPDAVVRAIAVTVFDADGTPIPNAHYEATVRSTTAEATDGAGLFAFSLVRGQYDVVASESSSNTSLVHSSVLVSPVDASAPVRGVTLALGPTSHFDGYASGPDGRALPYVTVQALPQRLVKSTGTASAYARVANISADVNSRFDLPVDYGTYDIVFSLATSEGLPTFVLSNFAIGVVEFSGVNIKLPAPVALFGLVTDADGNPQPLARVSAYYYREATATLRETVIPIAMATADSNGRYRLLVPANTRF